MRERAATIGAVLRIESRPGEGTTVTVVWSGQGAVRPASRAARGAGHTPTCAAPALSAEEETDATLTPEPKQEQVEKGKP